MTDDEILASCNVPWYFIGEKLRQSQGLNQLQRMKKKNYQWLEFTTFPCLRMCK